MQNLHRLLASVQESFPSSDVFSTKKASRPGGDPPFIRLTTQGVCLSPSRRSPAKSLRSPSSDTLPRATLPIPKAFLRSISRATSRPRQIEHRTEEDEMSTGRSEGGSKGASTGSANYAGLKTKRIRHVRNRTEIIVPPDPTGLIRPSTSPCTSSGPSSRPDLATCLPQRRSLDMPTLGISSEDGDRHSADFRRLLTRSSTRTTNASKASDDTDTTFAPINYNWQPPTCWAGPSPEEHDRLKRAGWFARKKSAKSSSRIGNMLAHSRLNPARSLGRLKPVLLADPSEPKEEGDSVTQAGPRSSGVMVKIQCYEGGDGHWHEKPMVDIIPKLRELKSK